jgi:hypothetical protein
MTDTADIGPNDRVEVIRPAAVLESRVATLVLAALRRDDVSSGGVWNASASVWQRYDRPWLDRRRAVRRRAGRRRAHSRELPARGDQQRAEGRPVQDPALRRLNHLRP